MSSKFFFCLIGPSGAGKSALGERFFGLSDDVQLSVSCTTRTPREYETPGAHYEFLSREEFQKRADNKFFFEWEEIHGNLYGTPQSIIDGVIAGGHHLLFDIDVKGALSIKRAFKEKVIIVLVLPPSFEILTARLKKRGKMSEGDFAKRMSTLKEEYAYFASKDAHEMIDYLIVNEELDRCVGELLSIKKTHSLQFKNIDSNIIKRLLHV